jgi:hypothetical protein
VTRRARRDYKALPADGRRHEVHEVVLTVGDVLGPPR